MIRRFVALLVAAVVLVLAPACDYGDSVAWAAGVATGSDAEVGGVLDLPGVEGYGGTGSALGLLTSATEEELERYYQSFLDYPVSLLEWPEEVPQPRFAIAALGAAAVYLLEVLAVVVGIYTVGVSLDYLWQIYENYEASLRLEGKESLLQTWQDVLSAQWGDAISGMKDLYKDFKAYCKANVNGYATGDGTITVNIASDFIPISGPGIYFEDCFPLTITPGKSPVYVFYSFLRSSSFYLYTLSESEFTVNNATSSVSAKGYHILSHGINGDLFPNHRDYYPINPNVITLSDGLYYNLFIKYVESADFVLGREDEESVVPPAKPWADLQWNYYDLMQSVAVPANQAEADEILANAAVAGNAAEVAKALERTWEMGDAVTDEGEETYPWVPSITGWLEGIKSGIDSIKEKVTAIPETLARILDGVLAIPGQIADFFTLDTAVVSAEFAALQDAFTAKFAGISLLADVFTKSYSFDMTVPVFTVPVPEPLRELFGGQTEVVIMDLRPHTELFLRLRGLLIAMFWVAFAKWLLDQFDVKFHVG